MDFVQVQTCRLDSSSSKPCEIRIELFEGGVGYYPWMLSLPRWENLVQNQFLL